MDTSLNTSSPETANLMKLAISKSGGQLPAGATHEQIASAYGSLRSDNARAAEAEATRRAQSADARIAALRRGEVQSAGIDTKSMSDEEVSAAYPEARQILLRRRQEQEAVERAVERRRRAEALFHRAGCPDRHVVTIETIDAARCAPWKEMRDLLISQAHKANGFLVAMLGIRGTGKTQLAVSMTHQLCGDLFTCKYFKTMDLFRLVRATYGPVGRGERVERESDLIDSLTKLDFLALDEFHQRSESEWENNLLINLIDRRYDARKCTLLIANATRAEFSAAAGASVVSRLHEIGTVLETTWPSFRKPGGWIQNNKNDDRRPSGAII
jgi:DNA replication protein DnaC